MAKPQLLSEPLTTDLGEIKSLLDIRYSERENLIQEINEAKDDVDAYDRQIAKLRDQAKLILKVDELPQP